MKRALSPATNVKALSTAAGTIFKPTIEAIDRQLSDISSRYMFLEGDQDKLLDARLELMREMAARLEAEQ